MPILQAALLCFLLAVCCFSPGFFFVRKWPWSPLEKLCGAVGLSLLLLYLAAWGIYCFGFGAAGGRIHVLPWALVSLLAAGLGAAAWKDTARLVRHPSVRRTLAGFAFLLVWTCTLLAMIRVYSGGTWFGDWLEHFHRSLFFLYRYPVATTIFPSYPLPARPPLMNLLAAFFLSQTADRFELFQLVFSFLNLLLFLPCCLIMPALGAVTAAARGKAAPGKRRTLLLVALFAASPVIMENATYSWTKAGAAFYVVLAFALYLAGWRKRDRLRTTAAFVALAAGLLVHYSAGPYILFLGVHYLWRIFPKRPEKWKDLAGILAACGLLLASWFGWSLAVYGAGKTLLSNTSVTLSQKYQGDALEKIALNAVDTVVPHLLRDPDAWKSFDQPSRAGFLRDGAFAFYQLNLIFSFGLAGGPLVLWLLYRGLRGPRKPQPETAAAGAKPKRRGGKIAAKAPPAPRPAPVRERRFWAAAIFCCVLVGIAVVGERDPKGVSHLTLLPLVALGLSLLAAAAPWHKRGFAILIVAGCVVDFSLGVFLNARVESQENTPRRTVYGEFVFQNGQFGEAVPPASLSAMAWENWYRKHLYTLTGRWLRDMPRQHGDDPNFQAQWPMAQANFERQRAEWVRDWYGWWERHGGEIRFLGDRVAGPDGRGTDIATALLLVLFAGMMSVLLVSRIKEGGHR